MRLILPTTNLHTKLMLPLAILISLAVGCVSYLLIEHERDTRLAELETRADNITRLISGSVAYSVWNVDLTAIDEQLASLILSPEVMYISISAVGYGKLHEISKPHAPLIEPIERTQPINFIANDGNLQHIGEVRIVITRSLVDQTIDNAHQAAIGLVVMILSILYITTFLLIKRVVSAPVSRLETLVDRIANGDLDARCSIASNDELGRLAGRVNMMAERLSESDRSLRDSQENLSTTLDSIGDAVIVTDARGLISRMNPTAERLTGWLNAEAIGLPLIDVFHIVSVETGEPVVNPVQLVFEQGEVVGLANHTVLLARDGKAYQISDSAAPIRKGDNEIIGVVLVFSDVSEQYKTNSELAATQAHLQAILDAIPDVLFEVDLEGRVLRHHTHRSDLFLESPEAFLGKRFADVLPPAASLICMEAIQEAAQNGWSAGATYSLMLPQGETWFELSVAAMPYADNDLQHFTVITRNVTERKQAEAKLQLAASVFVNAGEGIIITDLQGIIIDVNQAFSNITGYSRKDAIGKNTSILRSDRHDQAFYDARLQILIESGHWSGEVWNRRKDGKVYAELLTINAVRDAQGNTYQYVALFSDITAIKAHQSELEYIAHFDALTNLPNRVLLADRLHQAMSQTQRREKQLAVAFLDLDGFKEVNDRYAHQMGEQVLVKLTQRMTDTLREGDTLARMGGDEFVAVFIDLDNPSDSIPLVKRLLAAAAQTMQIGDINLQVSASIGITYYPQTQDIDADQLLRQADQAMYQAKVAGKNRYHIFDAAQDNNLRWYHETLERIRLALDQNEFILYYQPKINMRTGELVGVEALIRWQHPEKGILPPMAFLPALEDHPLAVALGEWVLDTALTQLEQWHAAGLKIPEVSVNVCARQLQQSDFVKRLKFILNKHPLVDPARLQIEILETSALADMAQVSQIIEECAQLGIAFALDDFGTGYSSLTYLKRLNVAMLKIDQSFVRDMLDDPDDFAILEGVIGLASAFKRQVIAEGVETIAHGSELLKLGCELVQGYGIARPMPGCELEAWTADWQANETWSELRVPGIPDKGCF